MRRKPNDEWRKQAIAAANAWHFTATTSLPRISTVVCDGIAQFLGATGANALMDLQRSDLEGVASTMGWPIEYVMGSTPEVAPREVPDDVDLGAAVESNTVGNLVTALPSAGASAAVQVAAGGAAKGVGAALKILGGSTLAGIGINILWDCLHQAFSNADANSLLEAYGDGYTAGLTVGMELTPVVTQAFAAKGAMISNERERLLGLIAKADHPTLLQAHP